MADEVFKQSRKKISPDEINVAPASRGTPEGNPLESVKQMQSMLAKETGKEVPREMQEAPFEIAGNVPPEFREALMRHQQMAKNNPSFQDATSPARKEQEEDEKFETFEAPPDRPRQLPKQRATPDSKIRMQGSDKLEEALRKLAPLQHWEMFEFPSKGKFYNDIPGVVHIRAMTGEEEQILATPRWVKKGKAIDMIFNRCIKEPINTEELLSVDRTHLLIFLRGISYTPEYDVEIKCPNCTMRFAHVIELNDLDVEVCPETFGPDRLSGTLPASGFSYTYRLATGQDEQEIAAYRERRINQWGDQGEDDTLLYRTALLLEEIEGVTMKKELALLLKKLPIQDVGFLRNEINQPPFGVKTELPILCPNCQDEFKIDLPMETNFFFPKKKEERMPA
jgi:hypothetical protein